MEATKIEQLREIFTQLDEDGNGILTVAELHKGLRSAKIAIPEEFSSIMEAVDSDNSGYIDYTEFIAATLQRKQYIQENTLWSAFRFFDRNGDGKISQRELSTVLSTNKEMLGSIGGGDVEDIMSEVDANGDGVI